MDPVFSAVGADVVDVLSCVVVDGEVDAKVVEWLGDFVGHDDAEDVFGLVFHAVGEVAGFEAVLVAFVVDDAGAQGVEVCEVEHELCVGYEHELEDAEDEEEDEGEDDAEFGHGLPLLVAVEAAGFCQFVFAPSVFCGCGAGCFSLWVSL